MICPECGIDWDVDYNDDCPHCVGEFEDGEGEDE